MRKGKKLRIQLFVISEQLPKTGKRYNTNYYNLILDYHRFGHEFSRGRGKQVVKQKVYEVLNKLNIEFEAIDHPALFTCEDNEKYGLKFNGEVCKNLFIRNKNKSKYYLVSLSLNKRANLKELEEKLHETRLSFGNEEVLFEKLKIKPRFCIFIKYN
ncbi:MAG: hypothetical protein LBL91_02575 [Lachnospiraceae bacterium]|jgi:hypothetical protein|nr:hypothetical protein [Lachnospiraceae bacterium]